MSSIIIHLIRLISLMITKKFNFKLYFIYIFLIVDLSLALWHIVTYFRNITALWYK